MIHQQIEKTNGRLNEHENYLLLHHKIGSSNGLLPQKRKFKFLVFQIEVKVTHTQNNRKFPTWHKAFWEMRYISWLWSLSSFISLSTDTVVFNRDHSLTATLCSSTLKTPKPSIRHLLSECISLTPLKHFKEGKTCKENINKQPEIYRERGKGREKNKEWDQWGGRGGVI